MFRFNELISKVTIDATGKGDSSIQRKFIEALNKADKESNKNK